MTSLLAKVTPLALALAPAAWLLPNHYPPWVSAWPDGWALACIALAAICAREAVAPARAWLLAVAVAGLSVLYQWGTGKIAFGGDAIMVSLYLGAFVIALALGGGVTRRSNISTVTATPDAVSLFALGLLAAAVLSVAAALVQWTGVPLARGWVVDMPPGGRPFSNLAQPNHFSSAAFLGLIAAGVLREARHLGQVGFAAAATFMLLGIVMSGSRTGWLQMCLAALIVAWYGARLHLTIRLRHVVALALVGLALQAAWSPLDSLLDRHVDRPLDEKLAAGARPALWREMLGAVAKEPLAGFGWMQIGAAQQRVAPERPPQPAFFEHFDHAHNVVLDLVLWAGIPVGGLVVILAAAAIWQQLKRLDDPRALWLMIGVLGLVLHGLLEFPLTFAYFLVPAGVMLGMAAGLTTRVLAASPAPSRLLPVGGAALALVLALVTVDYLKVEENFRLARLETARIGTSRVGTEVPDLRLLTQLGAYLRFVRTEARPAMSPDELDWMGQVSRRFGYAPVLFRYALALGLNRRPEEAAATLKLLCHVHSRARCEEVREVWPSLQQRHPSLVAVPAP